MINENNIILQIVNDEKTEVKISFMDAVNSFYDMYLGTLNNEEKGYMNNEDERACFEIDTIYPSEIGITIANNPLLRFGTCKRNLFFKLVSAIKDENKNFDEVASIERINLIKEQWIEKFKLVGLYKENEKQLINFKALGGKIKIANTSDGLLYDPSLCSETVLLIKPIDHNFITKESVFGANGEPMMEHLGEALSVAMANKKQVKLLYVGKNKASEFKEYNIGAKAGVVNINGTERHDLNLTNILYEFNIISKMFESNMVPPRDYGRPGALNQEQIEVLKKYKVIQEKDAWKYLNGKEMYKPFRCEICKYKKTCDAISDSWSEWEK